MDNSNKPGSPFDVNPPAAGGTPSPVFPAEPPASPSFPPPPPPTPPPLENPWGAPVPPQPPPLSTPLDNPWGVPPQPPPIAPSPTPTWTPPEVSNIPPPPPPQPATPEPTPLPTNPTETAPTDLSHLVGNSAPEPETLVMPAAAAEAPTYPSEDGKRGVPKWLIGLGLGLLLAVVGTSAYFIMGIGQAPKGGSIPAVPTETTQQVKPPAPLPTPAAESETSSFGSLEGTGQSATSAADLIRQRQQQGQ